MRSPAEEIAAISEVLRRHDIAHALIGGWAVVAWGYVRASDDLDLLIDLPQAKRKPLLESLSADWKAQWRSGGEDDPVAGLLRAEPKSGGLPVDLLPARGLQDRQALARAAQVTMDGVTVRIVRPEDLLAMKLEAGGGQDYEDVRRLLGVLADKLDLAVVKERCAERKVSDRLELALVRLQND